MTIEEQTVTMTGQQTVAMEEPTDSDNGEIRGNQQTVAMDESGGTNTCIDLLLLQAAVFWVLALTEVQLSGAAWCQQRLLVPSSPAHLAHPLNR